MASKELEKDFKEQYYILKEEEQREQRNKVLILIFICVLSMIVITLNILFFTYTRNNDEESLSAYIDSILKVTYKNDSEIIIENISSDWTGETKIVEVKNNGNVDATYNINLENVFNSFEADANLIFSVKRNNVVLINNEPLPIDSKAIVSEVLIPAGETHLYQIIFSSADNLEIAQEETKSFRGDIKIVLK